MKKLVLSVIALVSISILHAQPGKTKTTVKTTAPVLKNLSDSASYAIGVSVVNFYKQQGITNLNTTLIAKAINDAQTGKKSLLDDAAANACMNSYLTKVQMEKTKPNITAGEVFLAKNKLKAGVTTTASGLQYEVEREGTGPKPLATDSVTCNYKGTLPDGTTFDDSYERGAPITFFLGGVIRGWTEGLQLMNEGSKYKFYIPYQLAYGPNDYGPIPGGSMLTFEVELLKVIKKQ